MNTAIILLSVAAIWGVAVVAPGPNFFITVKTAVGQSRPAAFCAALGTSTGTIIWGVSGFLGIALLFKASPWSCISLKLLGGAYLIYLSVSLIIATIKEGADQEIPAADAIDMRHGYRLGLITNLSNPKTATFVTSLFAFTMPAGAPLVLGCMSAGLMTLISIGWYTFVAYVFSLDHFRRLYLAGRKWVERAAGVLFLGFGLKLVSIE